MLGMKSIPSALLQQLGLAKFFPRLKNSKRGYYVTQEGLMVLFCQGFKSANCRGWMRDHVAKVFGEGLRLSGVKREGEEMHREQKRRKVDKEEVEEEISQKREVFFFFFFFF